MTTYIGTAELDDNGKKQPSTPVFIVSGLIKHDKPEKRFTTEDYSLLFHELGHVYTRIISSSQVSLSPPSPIPMELTEA